MAVVATRPVFPGEGSPHDGAGQAGFVGPMANSHHSPALQSDPGAMLVHPSINPHQESSPNFPQYGSDALHGHAFNTPARHVPPAPASAPGGPPEADNAGGLRSNVTWSQPRKDAVSEQQGDAVEGSDAPVDPTPKRLRGSYRCRRCGQPKKGHTCTQQAAGVDVASGNSPSGSVYGTPGSGATPSAVTPLGAGGAMMPQGSAPSLMHSAMGSTGHPSRQDTPGGSFHEYAPHPGVAQTVPHAQGFRSPHPSAALLGCAVSETGGKARPSAAALGIQPTRLAGLGMSPNPGPTLPGPTNPSVLSQHHQPQHPQHHQPSHPQHHQQVSPGGGSTGGAAVHQSLQPGAGMSAQWSSAKPASFAAPAPHTSSDLLLQGGPFPSNPTQNPGAHGSSSMNQGMEVEQRQHQQRMQQQSSLQCGPSSERPSDGMETSQTRMSTSPMTAAGTPAPAQGLPEGQAHLLRAQHLCTPSSTATPSSAFTPSTATTTSSDFSGAAAMGLVTPSPAPSISGASIASVLHRVLSMSALAQPPVFDEYGIPRSASFAAPFSSPSGTDTSDAQDGAGPDSVQKDKPKPELVKRSEQDMCMVNILAKLLPQDLMAAAQCCRRWRRLAADVWFSVETAVLVLDERKRPSEYVPFVLRKSPRLAHLTLHTRRWVIDDHLLLRIASERPSLVSLVIRPEADIDCRITEFGLSAFVRGCRLLEKVEIGNSFRMGGVQLQSHSLRSLTLLASTSLSTRFSLACPSLLELSLSFFSASARVPVEGAEALAQPQRQPLPCAWDAISPGNWNSASLAAGTPSDCPKKARVQGVQEAAALPPPAFGDSKAAVGAAPALPSKETQPQGQGEQAMADAEGAKTEKGEGGDALALVAACAVQEQEEQQQEEEEEEKKRAEREQQQKQQEQAMCLRALPQHASPRRVNAVLQQVANMSNPLKRLHVAALHTSDLMVSGLMAAHAQSLRALSLTHSQLLTDEGVKLISSCCKQLEFLDVSGCSKLTDKSLDHLSTHSSPSLNRLLVAACRRLTARGVEKAVASLPHLALLDLGHVLISEDQFGSGKPSLEVVSFTPESLKGVRRFGQLQEVNSSGTGLGPVQQGASGRLGGKENSSPKLMIWGNGFLGTQMTPQKRKGGHEGHNGEGDAGEGNSACILRLRSSSLHQLSLWGCSAVQSLELQCSELRELSLNCCPALATAASSEQLRSMCPSLRSIHTEVGGAAGSDGAEDEEDGEDEDYDEGDAY